MVTKELKEKLAEPRPITIWREEEKPREKLLIHGASALTEAELIALVIGSGTRRQSAVDLGLKLLEENEGLQELARLGIRDLCQLRGIGPAIASKLVAAFELGRRRMAKRKPEEKLNSPEEIANFVRPWLVDLTHEEFYVMYLSSSLRFKGRTKISQGGVNSTLVDPKIIFREAMLFRSPCLILCHNHPSGNPAPSEADFRLTEKLARGAQLIDSKIVDHVIVGQEGFYSFQESGRMREIYARIY